MEQDKPKRKLTNKKPEVDKKAAEVIKIMANTQPISNEELKKKSKKRTQ